MIYYTTITVESTNAIEINSLISITTNDLRWWRRFWFWLLDKGLPQKIEYLTVVGKTNTTLTVKRV